MTDPPEQSDKTQKTQPAKGKPIDIPVPKREDIERLLTKAANPMHGGDPSSK